MAFSRRLGVIGILGVSWLVVIACDDDDDRRVIPFSDGGEAGESTTGGKTSGGSSSVAGKGGSTTAGKGGGGSGGTGDAAAGQAGNGAGGESLAGANAGGESAGGAGSANGGAGGAGGAPQPPAAKKCDYACNITADCFIGADAAPRECDPVLKRCRLPRQCDAAAECVPSGSFWFTTCADDSECFADLESCVAWQGVGYCASLPDPSSSDSPCTFGAPATLSRFGAAGTVEACVDQTNICTADGACEPGCGSLGCGAGAGDSCNPTTGVCECAESTECTANGVSVCGDDSRCGCATSEDCQETSSSTGLDTCFSGTCGCDTAASCPDPGYANATAVCE
jgi:hypothetical protein